MSLLGLVLCVVCAIALLALPRRWAPVPLLIGCCYITAGQVLTIGSLNLPVFRLLLAVGFLRVVLRKEGLPGGFTTIDKLLIAWGVWTLFASLFQRFEPGSGPQYAANVVSTVGTAYFVPRMLCRDVDDTHNLLKAMCLVLVPIALAMLYEKFSNYNVFSIFGRVSEIPDVRDGQIRAQGPFSHPILAGTIGAGCFPFALFLWNRDRTAALIGAAACATIVMASASSGPIMGLLLGMFAVGMWRYRQHCGKLRKLAVITYLVLIPIMSQPPYYLMARINLTGSSTGWHRAHLIEQTFKHFGEWALFGTNRTRHWMPTQGHISETQTDITNYYIAFGVLGGVICMALVILIVWRAFKSVGEYVRHPTTSAAEAFAVWCVGASLFSHAMSSLSVAYFGQAPVFFWLPIGIIASLHAGLANRKPASPASPPYQRSSVGAPSTPRTFSELLNHRPQPASIES